MNAMDELIRLGLVTPPTTGGAATPTVASWVPPPPLDSADFVMPSWYSILEYCICAGTERGCMLFGPKGSGKSTAIRHLAKQASANLLTIQCFANMQVDTLLGTWTVVNGATVYAEGPLTQAWRAGLNGTLSILAAEEANVAHPGVWSVANNLTDRTQDGLVLPTGEVIPYSPGFRLILLFNEGSQYAGTRDVNAALKRRLMPIYCEYPDSASEEKMLALMCPSADPAILADAVSMAVMVRAGNVGMDLSTDILARMINLKFAVAGMDWRTAFDRVICDSIGAPEITKPQRAVMTEIAQNTVQNWV